ncbi:MULTISPECIES: GUN4 domain-containing protein [Microcystis]|uniref:GUN4 domain-containing protein n=2 Tax=Microcystis TaxID=1125 RepID=A0A841UWI6_MICAE|nr:serine/threonine kinase [Microcystis panniformis FACHB-1757]MBC1193264.1 GUN4 domain-containing protein [Microcystis aeruginosa BLCC-F108]MCA2592505.1 GUN4 domain-containing protein [Microcystis sp. M31BS1]TRT75886.1 MAG: GUN4 domain-containing protein [Microcystis sp. M_OC_Ca_00000000_S217Cul]TRT86274.1 MAG: GUN4 domain-containing protein [Microcystis sp. M_OC_Ca_00000000_C217Col]
MHDYLAAENWKEADKETGEVMCRVAGRESEGWLREEDIDNFPCEDLRTINQLWLNYSSGKFGFSVQKEIYESLGGTRKYNSELEVEVLEKFADSVGWRQGGRCLTGRQLTFNSAVFNSAVPKRHLPVPGVFGGEKSVLLGIAACGVPFLAQRLVSCRI